MSAEAKRNQGAFGELANSDVEGSQHLVEGLYLVEERPFAREYEYGFGSARSWTGWWS